MEQIREQIAQQPRRSGNPNWEPGMRSPNPRGAALVKERRQAVEAALLVELGGIELDALDQALMRRAVEALMRKPRNDVTRAALLNVSSRTIERIRRRHAPQRDPDTALLLGTMP